MHAPPRLRLHPDHSYKPPDEREEALERSLEFWCGLFGFEIAYRPAAKFL
jgi:hypothetical protein